MSTQTKTELSPQGQRAGALQLTFNELTKNEQLLVTHCAQDGRPVFTIVELMEGLNWHKMKGGRARGCSRVRNTLRRLVRSQWLVHANEIGDGKYRLSKNGLDRLRRIVKDGDKPNAKPVPAPLTDKQLEAAAEQEF